MQLVQLLLQERKCVWGRERESVLILFLSFHVLSVMSPQSLMLGCSPTCPKISGRVLKRGVEKNGGQKISYSSLLSQLVPGACGKAGLNFEWWSGLSRPLTLSLSLSLTHTLTHNAAAVVAAIASTYDVVSPSLPSQSPGVIYQHVSIRVNNIGIFRWNVIDSFRFRVPPISDRSKIIATRLKDL